MDAQSLAFPLSFDVDYPDRELNRWTTAFRLILAIPVLIVLALLSGGPAGVHIALIGASLLLFVPTLLLILFRQKYPRWWFDSRLDCCDSMPA